jgi:hypothetical protein
MMCVRIILSNKKIDDEILSTDKIENKEEEEENPAKRFKQDSSE